MRMCTRPLLSPHTQIVDVSSPKLFRKENAASMSSGSLLGAACDAALAVGETVGGGRCQSMRGCDSLVRLKDVRGEPEGGGFCCGVPGSGGVCMFERLRFEPCCLRVCLPAACFIITATAASSSVTTMMIIVIVIVILVVVVIRCSSSSSPPHHHHHHHHHHHRYQHHHRHHHHHHHHPVSLSNYLHLLQSIVIVIVVVIIITGIIIIVIVIVIIITSHLSPPALIVDPPLPKRSNWIDVLAIGGRFKSSLRVRGRRYVEPVDPFLVANALESKTRLDRSSVRPRRFCVCAR
eukprot:507078-Rhodomonas_salina.1